jgi:hypothetical protein
LCVDWLHTLSLGVFQFFLAVLLWRFLLLNPWKLDGPPASWPERGLNHFRSLLFLWYNREEQLGRNHTRVQNLTSGMIGTAEKP